MQKIPNLQVYKKRDVPVEYHYRSNRRIGQIVAIANEGYKLTEDEKPYLTRGAHGYNNTLETMRTIFLASGPNIEAGKKLEPFVNVNVYSLMCKLLEIQCLPSNGTFTVFRSVYKNKATKLGSASTLSLLIFLFILLFI